MRLTILNICNHPHREIYLRLKYTPLLLYCINGMGQKAGGPSFRDVTKGWEFLRPSDQTRALTSTAVSSNLVGAVGIESNEKLYLKDLPGMRW